MSTAPGIYPTHGIETAICAGCLNRVSIHDLAVADGRCSHCRELKARTGLDQEGQPLGADAGVHIEDLNPVGNALLDERSFDGGDSLVACDEV